jgi:hypothetical protein
VVALDKPSDRERGQWYFQRYVQHLPTAGEMVFFDRSWYNRAGVERVMGFCTPHEYLEFMRQTPQFERMLANSGVLLFKYWFSVSREEQLRRFISRRDDPLKHWKLSPIDIKSLDMWDAYTEAKNAMFFHTDTADAPWVVIKSDDKKRARSIACGISCIPCIIRTRICMSRISRITCWSAPALRFWRARKHPSSPGSECRDRRGSDRDQAEQAKHQQDDAASHDVAVRFLQVLADFQAHLARPS